MLPHNFHLHLELSEVTMVWYRIAGADRKSRVGEERLEVIEGREGLKSRRLTSPPPPPMLLVPPLSRSATATDTVTIGAALRLRRLFH